MALPITVKADYKGRLRISTSKGSQLEEYITEYEHFYLKTLINVEVYNDVKALNPLPQKYLDLINGVQYTNSFGNLVDFEGFKQVLLRLIYARYNADNFQTSIGGNVRSVNENSDVLTAGNTVIIAQRYNEAVNRYKKGVWGFLDEHKDLSQTITGSFSGGGFTTYTIDSTKYLSNGDTVTILGTEYTITNVITDTSFDITGISDDFTGETIKYKPFYEVCYKYIEYLGLI
jgi:hypothetical protein